MNPWRKTFAVPSAQNGSATRAEAITPPSGMYPEVMPFATVIRSGESPYRPVANHSPVRPKPVITSSRTSSTSRSRQISWTRSR